MNLAIKSVGTKLNILGMADEINSLICTVDKRKISKEEYKGWDHLTRKEYRQSGLCKECQDNFFIEADDEEEYYEDPPEYKIIETDFRWDDIDD